MGFSLCGGHLVSANAGDVDVALIGGGIMSATLGTLLSRARPEWSMVAYERLDAAGEESSYGWHNAGTGHAGLCELNYTPEMPDGSIDTTKAKVVNAQYHLRAPHELRHRREGRGFPAAAV
jgi:malate dehydrogenase (quinone)